MSEFDLTPLLDPLAIPGPSRLPIQQSSGPPQVTLQLGPTTSFKRSFEEFGFGGGLGGNDESGNSDGMESGRAEGSSNKRARSEGSSPQSSSSSSSNSIRNSIPSSPPPHTAVTGSPPSALSVTRPMTLPALEIPALPLFGPDELGGLDPIREQQERQDSSSDSSSASSYHSLQPPTDHSDIFNLDSSHTQTFDDNLAALRRSPPLTNVRPPIAASSSSRTGSRRSVSFGQGLPAVSPPFRWQDISADERPSNSSVHPNPRTATSGSRGANGPPTLPPIIPSMTTLEMDDNRPPWRQRSSTSVSGSTSAQYDFTPFPSWVTLSSSVTRRLRAPSAADTTTSTSNTTDQTSATPSRPLLSLSLPSWQLDEPPTTNRQPEGLSLNTQGSSVSVSQSSSRQTQTFGGPRPRLSPVGPSPSSIAPPFRTDDWDDWLLSMRGENASAADIPTGESRLSEGMITPTATTSTRDYEEEAQVRSSLGLSSPLSGGTSISSSNSMPTSLTNHALSRRRFVLPNREPFTTQESSTQHHLPHHSSANPHGSIFHPMRRQSSGDSTSSDLILHEHNDITPSINTRPRLTLPPPTIPALTSSSNPFGPGPGPSMQSNRSSAPTLPPQHPTLTDSTRFHPHHAHTRSTPIAPTRTDSPLARSSREDASGPPRIDPIFRPLELPSTTDGIWGLGPPDPLWEPSSLQDHSADRPASQTRFHGRPGSQDHLSGRLTSSRDRPEERGRPVSSNNPSLRTHIISSYNHRAQARMLREREREQRHDRHRERDPSLWFPPSDGSGDESDEGIERARDRHRSTITRDTARRNSLLQPPSYLPPSLRESLHHRTASTPVSQTAVTESARMRELGGSLRERTDALRQLSEELGAMVDRVARVDPFIESGSLLRTVGDGGMNDSITHSARREERSSSAMLPQRFLDSQRGIHASESSWQAVNPWGSHRRGRPVEPQELPTHLPDHENQRPNTRDEDDVPEYNNRMHARLLSLASGLGRPSSPLPIPSSASERLPSSSSSSRAIRYPFLSLATATRTPNMSTFPNIDVPSPSPSPPIAPPTGYLPFSFLGPGSVRDPRRFHNGRRSPSPSRSTSPALDMRSVFDSQVTMTDSHASPQNRPERTGSRRFAEDLDRAAARRRSGYNTSIAAPTPASSSPRRGLSLLTEWDTFPPSVPSPSLEQTTNIPWQLEGFGLPPQVHASGPNFNARRNVSFAEPSTGTASSMESFASSSSSADVPQLPPPRLPGPLDFERSADDYLRAYREQLVQNLPPAQPTESEDVDMDQVDSSVGIGGRTSAPLTRDHSSRRNETLASFLSRVEADRRAPSPEDHNMDLDPPVLPPLMFQGTGTRSSSIPRRQGTHRTNVRSSRPAAIPSVSSSTDLGTSIHREQHHLHSAISRRIAAIRDPRSQINAAYESLEESLNASSTSTEPSRPSETRAHASWDQSERVRILRDAMGDLRRTRREQATGESSSSRRWGDFFDSDSSVDPQPRVGPSRRRRTPPPFRPSSSSWTPPDTDFLSIPRRAQQQDNDPETTFLAAMDRINGLDDRSSEQERTFLRSRHHTAIADYLRRQASSHEHTLDGLGTGTEAAARESRRQGSRTRPGQFGLSIGGSPVLGTSGGLARLRRNLGDYMPDELFDSSYESLVRLAASIGEAKPKGTPASVIAALPTGLYKDLADGSQVETRCPICLDDYTTLDICAKLDCQHFFHKDCVHQWLQGARSCPVCRRHVKKDNSKRRDPGPGSSAAESSSHGGTSNRRHDGRDGRQGGPASLDSN